MSQILEFYPEDEKYLEAIWDKFPFCDPRFTYLKFKSVRKAIEKGDYVFFLRQIKNSFFPDQGDLTVNEEYKKAINRGIASINSLCRVHLPEDIYGFFAINDVEDTLDLFELLKSATEDWIAARNGRHGSHDPNLLFSAYNKVRAYGLGYYTLMIDESPEVINSLRHYRAALRWFDERFGFDDPQEVDLESFTHSWQTNVGVKVYGTLENPIKSRLKILDSQTGEVKYASILMKMFLKGHYPEGIKDYAGIEFTVEDEVAREELLRYIRTEIRATEKMEAFKESKKAKTNPYSSSDFGVTKFILRPPVHVGHIEGHPLGDLAYERGPVEVQILTLADDEKRRKDPDVTHKEYKKRQFMSVFPAWFPRRIYEPLNKI